MLACFLFATMVFFLFFSFFCTCVFFDYLTFCHLRAITFHFVLNEESESIENIDWPIEIPLSNEILCKCLLSGTTAQNCPDINTGKDGSSCWSFPEYFQLSL